MLQKTHLGLYALIEKNNSLLLIKKSRGPYRGTYDLPGGRPHHGETPFQTLQREIREETGILLQEALPYRNTAFVVDYEEKGEQISLHHICLLYKATRFDDTSFDPTIDEEDASGALWIPHERLKDYPLSEVVLSAL